MLSNGIWTKSEELLSDHIFYGIPNAQELEFRYKNKTTMVIGSGHSAINAFLDLAELKEEYPDTIIHWVLRKKHVSEAYGGQENDGLQARGELGIKIQRPVDSKKVQVLTPFYISEVYESNGKMNVSGGLKGKESTISGIDEIVVSTGLWPDVTFLSEIRLSLVPTVESVKTLAPLMLT